MRRPSPWGSRWPPVPVWERGPRVAPRRYRACARTVPLRSAYSHARGVLLHTDAYDPRGAPSTSHRGDRTGRLRRWLGRRRIERHRVSKPGKFALPPERAGGARPAPAQASRRDRRRLPTHLERVQALRAPLRSARPAGGAARQAPGGRPGQPTRGGVHRAPDREAPPEQESGRHAEQGIPTSGATDRGRQQAIAGPSPGRLRGGAAGPRSPGPAVGLLMASLLDKRLVYVTGKGGVGKTTVAAALGLAA